MLSILWAMGWRAAPLIVAIVVVFALGDYALNCMIEAAWKQIIVTPSYPCHTQGDGQ